MIAKICIVGLMSCGMAMGQAAGAPAAGAAASQPAAAAPAKAYAFDVVSIRQNKTPATVAVLKQDGPTADGYRSHQPLTLLLLTAYVPQLGGASFYNFQDQIKGLPDWLLSDGYDIDARIADEDRAEWQKPESQKVMLQAMLQAMFAERCKMAVHREVKEVAVYSLVVAKGGPKFKETDPTVEHPDGIKLPWGGVMVPGKDGMNLYGTSMASLASLLGGSGGAGRTIQDKTGLTGSYDLVMKNPDRGGPAPGEQQGGPTASDPGGSAIYSVLGDLGLKLESAKGQVETLVIDHMERPSEN
jgi:uncharacterized protein (TIGR03435 family)